MRAASQQHEQNNVYAARQNRVLQHMYCRGDGTGRRAGLKIRCQKWRGGSIPPPGTKLFLYRVNRIFKSCVITDTTPVSVVF